MWLGISHVVLIIFEASWVSWAGLVCLVGCEDGIGSPPSFALASESAVPSEGPARAAHGPGGPSPGAP